MSNTLYNNYELEDFFADEPVLFYDCLICGDNMNSDDRDDHIESHSTEEIAKHLEDTGTDRNEINEAIREDLDE